MGGTQVFRDGFSGEGFAYARRAGEAGVMISARSWTYVSDVAKIGGEERNGLDSGAYRTVMPRPFLETTSSKMSLCTD